MDRLKWSDFGTSRIKPPENTLLALKGMSEKIGVTRIGNITHLDRLGIPNYSVVLPGTEDYIWVYSGKGFTMKQARTSGLMEAIERYSSLPGSYNRQFVKGSYVELSKRYSNILRPDDVCEPLSVPYKEDTILDYISGFDLVSREQILVPAALVLFRYNQTMKTNNPFSLSHTNGLASGNVLEEAICHALCEVIERDASSLADLRSSAIPYHLIKTLTNKFRQRGYAVNDITSDVLVDEPNLFPMLDLGDDIFQSARILIDRFKAAKISLTIKEITSDVGIPTFTAASVEWLTQDYGYLAEGTGTHPDARIALVRAITELAQTRAANIQGARDDLRKINYVGENSEDKKSWQFLKSDRKVRFSDIGSYYNKNILDDIRLIITHLKAVGLKKAIVVDLTVPQIGIPVVRVIVPGLETFKFTKSIVGHRARNYFRV